MNRLLMTLALCLLLCAPAWACDDDACRDDVGQLARMNPAMLGASSGAAAATYVFPVNITGDSDFDGAADWASNTVALGGTIKLPTKTITKLYLFLYDKGTATECSIGLFTDTSTPQLLAGCYFTPSNGWNSCSINYSATAGNFELWAQCNQAYRVWKCADNDPDCDNYYRIANTYTQGMSSLTGRSFDVGCGGYKVSY